MTSVYCVPGYWLITEASATSASNLEWMISTLMSGEQAEAQAKGCSVYSLANQMVAGVAPADSDVLFLPFLYGSNEGPGASACFLGLHGWHGKEHMLRAVYEGVVFSHKTHVDRLLGRRGPAAAARIAGGAVKSDVWVQMFADVLQLPIELTAGEELGAMGAAISTVSPSGCSARFPRLFAQWCACRAPWSRTRKTTRSTGRNTVGTRNTWRRSTAPGEANGGTVKEDMSCTRRKNSRLSTSELPLTATGS